MKFDSHRSPCNFRWIVKDRLAVSGLPETFDSLLWLQNCGIRLVIHLCKECPPNNSAYQQAGIELYYSPVDDYAAPTLAEGRFILSKINASIANARPVHICCHSGIGRAPTVAAMYLVSTGIPAEEALNRLGMCRSLGGYGSQLQRNAVHNLAQQLSHRFDYDVRIE